MAKEFQEQGYARKLVAGMFTHAKNKHVHLIGSSRTALGEDRLASLIKEYAKKFNVRYISATEYQ